MAEARLARLRWPTAAVACVLVVITAGATVGAYRVNRTEERRLLHERASEIALVLAENFSGLQTQMATVAAETALNGADPQAFRRAANALAPSGGGFVSDTGLASVDLVAHRARFVATSGSVSAVPTAGVARLLLQAEAASTPGLASAVFGVGAKRSLGLAYAVGVRDLVVYEQLPLDLASAAVAATTSAPFQELNVALYAAPTRDPTALLVTTNGAVPAAGEVATALTAFGLDQWLVAVHPTSPLTGSLAANAYWLILAGGVLLTAVFGLLVEILLRRRDYALTLVAERTEELQESVAELERAQEKLVQTTRLAAIGQLASAIGHELRNPLGVITNAHYLLRTELARRDSGPDATRHLSTAEREVGAATLIVADLLDYARAREPVTSPVDVPELVGEVQTVLPAPPDVVVTRSDAAGLPAVRADRDQLRQVLLNLLSNAYEAMPEGGTVTITTAAVGDNVRITVADTGSGMDAETREQIFEPFFTRKTKGIGLGMSVTKRIVDTHHGVIAIDSEPGVGTTFRVDLPAADGKAGE